MSSIKHWIQIVNRSLFIGSMVQGTQSLPTNEELFIGENYSHRSIPENIILFRVFIPSQSIGHVRNG